MSASVSVIIPCRNEVMCIGTCLKAIHANTFPKDHVEVIVVDGMSDDGTRGVVSQFPFAALVDNPDRTTPQALNRGIEVAHGQYIIRVDAHCEVYPDYVDRCVQLLQTIPNVGCVGGVFENVHSGGSGEIISMALSSPFGVGNARYRLNPKEGPVDTVPFGAFPKAVFSEVGLFDEDLVRNQDDEFNFRLRKAGYVVWLSPLIRVKYHVRTSLVRMARQFSQYGFWKVYVNRKHHAVTTVRQLAPPAFVVALLAGAAFSLLSFHMLAAWLALIAVYILTASIFALTKTRHPVKVAKLVGCFFVLHFSYGIGYIQGLWRFVILRRKPGALHRALTR
jgi:glycosyltransferase involved in cell wall biosynthesis